jgi:hypothetical protein
MLTTTTSCLALPGIKRCERALCFSDFAEERVFKKEDEPSVLGHIDIVPLPSTEGLIPDSQVPPTIFQRLFAIVQYLRSVSKANGDKMQPYASTKLLIAFAHRRERLSALASCQKALRALSSGQTLKRPLAARRGGYWCDVELWELVLCTLTDMCA